MTNEAKMDIEILFVFACPTLCDRKAVRPTQATKVNNGISLATLSQQEGALGAPCTKATGAHLQFIQ